MNSLPFILSVLAFCGIASASTITLDSRQGLLTSFAGVETVATTPHYAWQPNNAVNPGDPTDHSAVWISYADTGYGGTHFQPRLATDPVVTVFDTFQSGAGFLTLSIWADDTAAVRLDGVLLIPPVFTQRIACSGQPIGCRPEDRGNIITALSAGQHMLSFELYQVGTGTDTISNPFGLLFTGTAPAPTLTVDSAAPEPATWGLFACGLSGLIWARRRKKQAALLPRRPKTL